MLRGGGHLWTVAVSGDPQTVMSQTQVDLGWGPLSCRCSITLMTRSFEERQLPLGGVAIAATYLVGLLVGVAVTGWPAVGQLNSTASSRPR
jgi:hypothetical protein